MMGVNEVLEVDVAPSGEPPSTDERMLAAVAYVSYLLGFWLIGALAIYLWQRDRSRFVTFHAVQALALQLMLVVAGMCIGGVFVAGLFGGALVGAFGSEAMGYVVMVGAAVAGIAMLLIPFVWLVKAAWRAWHGERYAAPLAGRLALRALDGSGTAPTARGAGR